MPRKSNLRIPMRPDPNPRRVPLEPVDALGRTIKRLPRSAYTDLVEEWKLQALSAARDELGNAIAPRISLRIGAGFLLVVLVAGAPLGVAGLLATLLTLFSVLILQELPLALWARSSRRSPSVVLSASGASTEIGGRSFGTATMFLLSTVGSLTNVLWGVGLAQLARVGLPEVAMAPVSAAALAHVLWGTAQVLPLPPFRAGQALAARLRPWLQFAHAAISFVAIASFGLWALRLPSLPAFFAIFVLSTVGSTIALRDAFREVRDEEAGVEALTAEAEACLRADEAQPASELARRGLNVALAEPHRAALWKVLAWAAIGKRDPFTAHAALSQLRPPARDPHVVAAYLACCNRTDEAIELLKEARRRGHRAREATKLLVDLLFQCGERGEALEVVNADRAILSAHDLAAIDAVIGTPTTTEPLQNG